MPKRWDTLIKMLMSANPQHLVSLLVSGAIFESVVDKELQVKTIDADLLYNIVWNGVPSVLHVEFQRYRDKDMGRRVWEYNTTTMILSKRPVCSFVIYLKPDGTIVEPPHKETLPNEKVSHIFYYTNVKLWELSRTTLLQPGLEGLLPLLPLTKGGTRDENVEAMISGLFVAGKQDLLSLAYAFSALVFDTVADKEWLKRRFAMIDEVLAGSWAYQELRERARNEVRAEMLQESLEQGLQQGMEQGQLTALRDVFVNMIRLRFPELLPLATQQAEKMKSAALHTIVVQFFTVQTEEEAEKLLRS